MKVISAIECDIGNLRSNNEDNFYYNGTYLNVSERDIPASSEKICEDNLQFYAVCDGMGGEAHGEDASLIAVKVLSKYHRMLSKMKYHNLTKYIDMYFSEVNNRICEVRKEHDNCRIGTTIALLAAEGENLHIINIGDSRVYKFRHNKLRQISEDHTPAVRAYRMGMITKEEMKTYPHRNKLTQYLGLAPEELNINPFRIQLKAKNNDRFLICSDGITDMLSDDEILQILKISRTPKEAAKALAESAKANGGRDNITAIVSDIKTGRRFFR